MRVVLQRVSKASCTVDGTITGQINNGYLILVGFTNGDDENKIKTEKENKLKETTRFCMTKNHHKNTYNEAKEIGRMDSDLIPLCDYILTTKNYFTTSSCAGRIALIGLGKN